MDAKKRQREPLERRGKIGSDTKGARRITALLYPGMVALDLVGPLEAFNYASLIARSETGAADAGYRIDLVAPSTGPVDTASPVTLQAQTDIARYCENTDNLLVPGMMDPASHAYRQADVLDWVRAQAGRSNRLLAICSGAFVFAEAGLLSDEPVTTHWNDAAALQERFPSLSVDPEKIFVKSGRLYTSGGVTAGIDLALAIIEEDLGHALALKVAKRMLVYLKRPGDQAQFSDMLAAQAQSTRFTELLDWIELHLKEPLTVEILSDRCAMSPRNFSRVFKAEMGVAPMAYVRGRRVEAARVQLEQTAKPIGKIAADVGFSSTDHFSRAFTLLKGTSPQAHRARFAIGSANA